jgi:hypothetical protein
MLVFFLFIKLVEIQNLIIWKKGSTQQPTSGNTEYSFEIQEFYINFARNNSILNFVKKTNQFSYGNRRTVHYPDGIRDEFYSIEQTNSIYFSLFFLLIVLYLLCTVGHLNGTALCPMLQTSIGPTCHCQHRRPAYQPHRPIRPSCWPDGARTETAKSE